MAHNIHIDKNNKASFFSLKEKPWHNLGKIVDEAPTSEEAIKLAGLDYEVGLASLYADLGKEEGHFSKPTLMLPTDPNSYPDQHKVKQVDGRFATYRKDTNAIFGVVGSRYEVVQNKDAFSFFDAIVGEGKAIYETAGALGQGETVFITAKLPDYIKVANNDDIEKYLLLWMSHDGTSSIQAMFTPIRVVCNNTLYMAVKNAVTKVTVRHTRSAHDNLKEAHKILGITSKLSADLEELYKRMTTVRIGESELISYIKGSLDLKPQEDGQFSTRATNIMREVLEYNEVGAGQDFESCKGTVFGAYNAITGYTSNVRSYKDQSSKMESLYTGNSLTINSRALTLAKDLIIN